MSKLVVSGTPWEKHGGIWVKREDLCCSGGPHFSKMRGLEAHLEKLSPRTPVGVLDTIHSQGGWGAAYICKALNLPCNVFYPGRPGEPIASKATQNAVNIGASPFPLTPGRSAVLWYRARKALADITLGLGYMLPNGLQLEESTEATRREVEDYTPADLFGGTWVVSVSTGQIAQGVSRALVNARIAPYLDTNLIAHLGFSRSVDKLRKKIDHPQLHLIDEGYSYRDSIEYPCPFPCNPYYDLKAWKWVNENLADLTPPVVFWNIGE